MSVLRVNKITDTSGTGPVEFSKGASFPQNVNFNDELRINSTGIMTAVNINASIINISGVCTATTFTGTVGSGLTGLPGTSNARAIALTLIT